MERRGFLKTVTVGLLAATFDPEKSLWLPGSKLISIPKTVTVKKTRSVGCSWHLYKLRPDGTYEDLGVLKSGTLRPLGIGDSYAAIEID